VQELYSAVVFNHDTNSFWIYHFWFTVAVYEPVSTDKEVNSPFSRNGHQFPRRERERRIVMEKSRYWRSKVTKRCAAALGTFGGRLRYGEVLGYGGVLGLS
jgi:hypothetical protein